MRWNMWRSAVKKLRINHIGGGILGAIVRQLGRALGLLTSYNPNPKLKIQTQHTLNLKSKNLRHQKENSVVPGIRRLSLRKCCFQGFPEERPGALLDPRMPRASGLGFRVQGLGLRVWGLGFRVWGLGFRV